MTSVRLIAFYLPQYHPIPENDQWWGKGFTEWRNVVNAKPLFRGHFQPQLPTDLGFYDLRIPEVRIEQAAYARKAGIHGFCYYYYYFNGKRLLERPLMEMLESVSPDFPFCICWANENWTRAWDGNESEVLIQQIHSREDDYRFITGLLPIFSDPRYIRVNNRILLLVYRVDQMPDPLQTTALWREFVKKEIGLDLYLCAVNNFVKDIDPRPIGFDATVQFPLDFNEGCRLDPVEFARINKLSPEKLKDHWFISYPLIVEHLLNLQKPEYTFFRGVFPSWDNTARRPRTSAVFVNATPEMYKLFLQATIAKTCLEHKGDERLIFINAWNEWAEGTHLEPDNRYGNRWLEVTSEAMSVPVDLESVNAEIRAKTSVSPYLVNKIRNGEDAIADAAFPGSGPNDSKRLTADDIRRTLTFRLGKAILWFPFQVRCLYRKFRTKSNES